MPLPFRGCASTRRATRPPTGFLEGIIPNPVDLLQGLALIGEAIAAFFEQVVAFLAELGMAVIGAIKAFLGQVAENDA